MTEEKAFSSLKSDLERAEFKCALNLYSFAYLAVATYYQMKKANKPAEQTILTAGVFASAYVANLRWLGTILFKKSGKKVTEDEVAARWKKYYVRIVETDLRPGMTYDNGINKNAPLTFDDFHSLIFKWREGTRQIYAEQKKAKENKR